MNTIGIVAEAMQTQASTRRRRPRSGSGGFPGEAGEKVGVPDDGWDMVEERPKAAGIGMRKGKEGKDKANAPSGAKPDAVKIELPHSMKNRPHFHSIRKKIP
ncbi:hypothetical protein [Paracidovorax avenae]|uniref:hypothetical protein n=1 Tax=Paracidovorax avenae TaxID=80867 RepID=UPI001F34FDAA|nr:hypothetical protein [Paracidovorax avenae]